MSKYKGKKINEIKSFSFKPILETCRRMYFLLSRSARVDRDYVGGRLVEKVIRRKNKSVSAAVNSEG